MEALLSTYRETGSRVELVYLIPKPLLLISVSKIERNRPWDMGMHVISELSLEGKVTEQQISLAGFQQVPGWLMYRAHGKGVSRVQGKPHLWLVPSHPRIGLNGCLCVSGSVLRPTGDGQSSVPACEEL